MGVKVLFQILADTGQTAYACHARFAGVFISTHLIDHERSYSRVQAKGLSLCFVSTLILLYSAFGDAKWKPKCTALALLLLSEVFHPFHSVPGMWITRN